MADTPAAPAGAGSAHTHAPNTSTSASQRLDERSRRDALTHHLHVAAAMSDLMAQALAAQSALDLVRLHCDAKPTEPAYEPLRAAAVGWSAGDDHVLLAENVTWVSGWIAGRLREAAEAIDTAPLPSQGETEAAR